MHELKKKDEDAKIARAEWEFVVPQGMMGPADSSRTDHAPSGNSGNSKASQIQWLGGIGRSGGK
jgi:hypothetical protein